MRQTSAEIDHAILDVAAGLFATHGFAHTSVQQIADAVGYSKPGLLHRFGCKDALYGAVLAEAEATALHLVGQAAAHGHHHQLLTAVTQRALERPGVMQLLLQSLKPSKRDPGVAAVQAAGHRLVDALGSPVSRPAQRLRVVLALQLVVTAATVQHASDADLRVAPEELVPLLVGLAAAVLGSPRD